MTGKRAAGAGCGPLKAVICRLAQPSPSWKTTCTSERLRHRLHVDTSRRSVVAWSLLKAQAVTPLEHGRYISLQCASESTKPYAHTIGCFLPPVESRKIWPGRLHQEQPSTRRSSENTNKENLSQIAAPLASFLVFRGSQGCFFACVFIIA